MEPSHDETLAQQIEHAQRQEYYAQAAVDKYTRDLAWARARLAELRARLEAE